MKKFLFYFYVPMTHLEFMKKVCFSEGGGRIGNYENCSFEVYGMGQFKPLKGSKAFLGNVGELEKVQEAKVEMILDENNRVGLLKAFLENHPYEEPAYGLIQLVNDH
jgi:hypothetical protein